MEELLTGLFFSVRALRSAVIESGKVSAERIEELYKAEVVKVQEENAKLKAEIEAKAKEVATEVKEVVGEIV
jgi:cell division protein FtsB